MLRLPPLYAIIDADITQRYGWSPPAMAEALLAGGARVIQLRAKRAHSRECLAWADAIVRAARACGARVILNDRPDLARMAGAAGVHVGQEDVSVGAARRLLGPEAIIGLSTHTRDQIEDAGSELPSYVAVGPVFDTESKATGYAAVGLSRVRDAVERQPARPVVAIGGMTVERAPGVLAAGAAAVAVMSDLLADGDPEGRARAYVSALGE